MSYIKDDVKLCNVVMPSAHNAGSFKMKPIACCQDGDLAQQFEYGIRHFCVRIDTDKNGRIVFCHGITKGLPFEPEMEKFRKIMDEHPSEFFILDIREHRTSMFSASKRFTPLLTLPLFSTVHRVFPMKFSETASLRE